MIWLSYETEKSRGGLIVLAWIDPEAVKGSAGSSVSNLSVHYSLHVGSILTKQDSHFSFCLCLCRIHVFARICSYCEYQSVSVYFSLNLMPDSQPISKARQVRCSTQQESHWHCSTGTMENGRWLVTANTVASLKQDAQCWFTSQSLKTRASDRNLYQGPGGVA